MPQVFLSLGSNIDPEGNIRKSVELLSRSMRVKAISTVCRTESIGPRPQPPFLNAVLAVETDLPPYVLKFDVLRKIETDLGRVRGADKYAPRPIDLDILVYGDLVIDEPDLTIPDPDIYTRPFLAIGLAELTPDLVLADTKRPVQSVVSRVSRAGMQELHDYTVSLRCYIQGESRENIHEWP